MKHVFTFSIFILLNILIVSCSEFLAINDDPDTLIELDPSLILPATQINIAGVVNGIYAPLGGIWSQHWTQSHTSNRYTKEDAYSLSNKDYNKSWETLYSGALIDLSVIRKHAEKEKRWNAYLQATCLMAYTYLMLTDFYDEIPFSEALLGAEGLTEPVFDKGEEVYDGLISMLNNALTKNFKNDKNRRIQTDFVFGHLDKSTQIDNWVKFTNTLKLKIYLRQTKARYNLAKTEIQKLLTEDNFLLEDASIDVFEDANMKSYPLYETHVRFVSISTDLKGSHTFISYLLANNDPRIDSYFFEGSDGHQGAYQGNFQATNISVHLIDVAKFKPTKAFYFFTTEEVNFLLAEAHLRFGNPALVKEYYDDGILESCIKNGVSGINLVQSGGSYEYPSGTFDENIKAIMMQKWTSMVDRGYESFFDQNRTGIPNISNIEADNLNYTPGELTFSKNGLTDGQFPRRLITPIITRRTNSNTPVEKPITVKVWWAQ